MGIIESLRSLLIELHAETEKTAIDDLAKKHLHSPRPFFTAKIWSTLSITTQNDPRIIALFRTSKMTRYKLDPEKFYAMQNSLAEVGLTEKESNEILLRRSSGNSAQALAKLYPELRKKYSHPYILRMARHGGGAGNLEAALKYHQEATALGFKEYEIAKILNHDGGSKTFTAGLKHYYQAKSLGFTHGQIVQILNRDGGSVALASNIKNAEDEAAQHQKTSSSSTPSESPIPLPVESDFDWQPTCDNISLEMDEVTEEWLLNLEPPFKKYKMDEDYGID